MSLVFRIHAIKRMFERNISDQDVRVVLKNGKTIEEYPTDVPFPSKLIFGQINNRPIHVVVAENQITNETIIITVYEPSLKKWNDDFETRRIL